MVNKEKESFYCMACDLTQMVCLVDSPSSILGLFCLDFLANFQARVNNILSQSIDEGRKSSVVQVKQCSESEYEMKLDGQ